MARKSARPTNDRSLDVDEDLCLDEDLHTLLDEIDEVTMAQDAHVQALMHEIEERYTTTVEECTQTGDPENVTSPVASTVPHTDDTPTQPRRSRRTQNPNYIPLKAREIQEGPQHLTRQIDKKCTKESKREY